MPYRVTYLTYYPVYEYLGAMDLLNCISSVSHTGNRILFKAMICCALI